MALLSKSSANEYGSINVSMAQKSITESSAFFFFLRLPSSSPSDSGVGVFLPNLLLLFLPVDGSGVSSIAAANEDSPRNTYMAAELTLGS